MHHPPSCNGRAAAGSYRCNSPGYCKVPTDVLRPATAEQQQGPTGVIHLATEKLPPTSHDATFDHAAKFPPTYRPRQATPSPFHDATIRDTIQQQPGNSGNILMQLDLDSSPYKSKCVKTSFQQYPAHYNLIFFPFLFLALHPTGTMSLTDLDSEDPFVNEVRKHCLEMGIKGDGTGSALNIFKILNNSRPHA